MIHLVEILGFGLCVWLIFYFYKKVSRKPENKPIAIFSTVIATIHFFVSILFYYALFSDFLGILFDQLLNVISMINPILYSTFFAYAVGQALGRSYSVDPIEIIEAFIIPILISTLICIWLSNIFAKIVRKIYRNIR